MSEQEKTYTLGAIGLAWDSVCATGQAVTWDKLHLALLPRFWCDARGDVHDRLEHDRKIALATYGLGETLSIAALLNATHEAGTLGW